MKNQRYPSLTKELVPYWLSNRPERQCDGRKTRPCATISEEQGHYPLKCRICGDTFMFKKQTAMFSKWIDHIKSYYLDKDLVKKILDSQRYSPP